MDGDYLRILGRASELINVGGEKVYPAEVESVLLEHADVLDAAVVGKPDAVRGQIVASSRVELRESGVLIGDLKAGSLTVAAGSKFDAMMARLAERPEDAALLRVLVGVFEALKPLGLDLDLPEDLELVRKLEAARP